MATYLEAPTYATGPLRLFLAGGISGCPDWQSELSLSLADLPNLEIYNPRRKNFDVTCAGEAYNQIRWEFDHLERADLIVFWFPQETIQPIALFELGRWSMTRTPIVLGVHPQYPRSLDIAAQYALVRPSASIYPSLEWLADETREMINFLSTY
jgi:hypothetical protein